MDDKPPVVDVDPRHAVAEQLFDKVAVNAEARIEELGSFVVREYQAYEGRDPRTGETVRVPSKRLPFFKVDDAMNHDVNGHGRAPTTAWLVGMIDELRAGKPVVFGRMGVFFLRTKPSVRGDDPSTGTTIVIPARSVMTFAPSRQLKQKVDGRPVARVVESAVIDAVLARLPRTAPRTLAELDAELAKRGIDYKANGVIEPWSRTPDGSGVTLVGTDRDGDPRWYVDGTSVLEPTDDEERTYAFDRRARDLLVVAAVRAAAGDAVLQARDLPRVLMRLGADTPFTLSDLPF